MITIPNRYYICLYLVVFSFNAEAQKLKIKNYSIGHRIFEIDAVGNNPTTISPLLKNPAAYQNFLNTIYQNSLWGNPEILHYHTFYINGEWHKDNPKSAFWKKYTLQGGAFLLSQSNRTQGQSQMNTLILTIQLSMSTNILFLKSNNFLVSMLA